MNEKREWSGKKLIPFVSFFCAAVCQFNEFTVDLCASDWMRDAFFYFVFFCWKFNSLGNYGVGFDEYR